MTTAIGLAIMQWQDATQAYDEAVGTRLGLNMAERHCIGLLYGGPQSAGAIATATGLTPAAVTALIDRLERAGYVERTDDPTDRRRREVRILPEAIEPIQAVYQPMQLRMFKLWSSYSARDLAVILDFVSRSTDLSVECTEGMAGSSARSSKGASGSAGASSS